MRLPRLPATQQVIAAAVVLVSIALLLLIFVLVPQIVNLRGLMAKESQASQDLESAKAALKQLEDLKRQSQKTEAQLIQVDRETPLDTEIPALIIQMEDVSKKSGISFISIKPGTPVQKDEYQEVPLDIKVDGYFYALLDFIYRVEKLPRLVNIVSIDIKEGKAKLPNIESSLKANVFVLTPGVKPKAAPGAGATPGGGTAPAGGGAGGATAPAGGQAQ